MMKIPAGGFRDLVDLVGVRRHSSRRPPRVDRPFGSFAWLKLADVTASRGSPVLESSMRRNPSDFSRILASAIDSRDSL